MGVRTNRNIKDVNPLNDLISLLDLFLHNLHSSSRTKPLRWPNHNSKLLLLFPQIPTPLLQLRMRRNNLDRNELLLSLPRHLPRYICELLNEVVPMFGRYQ